MAAVIDSTRVLWFAVIISLNALLAGALIVAHQNIPLEVHCIADSIFELIYICVNLYLRWGLRSSVASLSAFVLPFYGITSKLAGCIQVAVRRKVAFAVLNVSGKHGNKVARQSVLAGRTTLKRQMTELIRTKRGDSAGAGNDEARDRYQGRIALVSGAVMMVYGIVFMAVMLWRWNEVNTGCKVRFGDCLWDSMDPHILFGDGVYGSTSCGENKVETLQASACKFEQFPSAIKQEVFTSLVGLSFPGSSMTSIPPWLMDSARVTSLDLSGNPCLTQLELQDQGMAEIPRNFSAIFSATLVELNLSGNEFQEFDFAGDGMNQFELLQSIDLSQNRITVVSKLPEHLAARPSGANITLHLNVSANALQLGGAEDFDQLCLDFVRVARQLAVLDLSSNKIDDIPMSFVEGYAGHNGLLLADNPIETLFWSDVSCFGATGGNIPSWVSQLQALRQFTMSRCQVKEIPNSILPELTELESLDLRHNDLQMLPNLSFNRKLKELRLGGNVLAFPIALKSFTTLIELLILDLSGMSLSDVTLFTGGGAFVALQPLEELYLSNNLIGSIPPDSFRFNGNLTILHLDWNHLFELHEDVFAKLLKLRTLWLHSNRITILPESVFANMPELRTLSLSNNGITILPESVFANMPELRTLGLYGNRITILPESVFANMPELRELWLSNNDITSLRRDVFVYMSKLKKLTLQRNPIDVNEIVDAVRSLENLTELSITVPADLSGVDREAFSDLGSLKVLQLYSSVSAGGVWEDLDGDDCDAYVRWEWCVDSGYGPNWDPDYGGFSDYQNSDGIDASEACCDCGAEDKCTSNAACLYFHLPDTVECTVF